MSKTDCVGVAIVLAYGCVNLLAATTSLEPHWRLVAAIAVGVALGVRSYKTTNQ